MLFLLFVIILVIGIILHKRGKFEVLSDLIVTIFGFIVIISSICMAISYTDVNSTIELNRERYDALTYKVESGVCCDDFGLLSKEVIDEVQEWNEDLIFYQSIQDSLWFGIYYPNIYDEFERIDYEKYGRNK